MTLGLRKLIVFACLLVIAGGGYFVWERYQRVSANAPPKGIIGQVACQLRLRDVKTSNLKPDDQQFLTNCLMVGYISQSHIDDAGLSP